MPRAVLLFLKYPEPGRVKTRIAATAGQEQAVAIYRQLVAEVCAQVSAGNPGGSLRVLFDPPPRRHDVESWITALLPSASGAARGGAGPVALSGVEFLPQCSGDLGARLTEAFQDAFAAGFDRVAAIGSDCPDLTPELYAALWAALEQADCVLGPTPDGGYYVIGLRTPQPDLFAGVNWSTPSVLAETLDRAAQNRLRVHLLAEKSDIDTEADWHAALRRKTPAGPEVQQPGESRLDPGC